MKIKLGWKAHNSTTIWSFNEIFHLPSKLRFFCTNLNFGLFFFWYFFFQLKRVYSKTALFILIQFFFSQISWVQKRITGFFSVIFAFWAFFSLQCFFFSQLFIFKATIFIFISTWLILIFHHFLFINFIRTIFSCFFCLIFYV